MKSKARKRGSPVRKARDFVEDRLAEGRAAFAIEELLDETGLSLVAANNQLRRLGDRVRRVSRPQSFFLIVDPPHRAIGAPPPAWWLDDYFRWLGRPYYLALLSAAELYGAAPQAVQVHQVMTDRPRREISVGRVRIRFFVKHEVQQTPVGQPAGAHAPLRVSTREATALDLVAYAARIGGIERAHETLVPLLSRMRATELRKALDAQNKRLAAQRLGYLLERAGAERLAAAVDKWLPAARFWCSLTAGRKNQSREHGSPRWRVSVDAKGEW